MEGVLESLLLARQGETERRARACWTRPSRREDWHDWQLAAGTVVPPPAPLLLACARAAPGPPSAGAGVTWDSTLARGPRQLWRSCGREPAAWAARAPGLQRARLRCGLRWTAGVVGCACPLAQVGHWTRPVSVLLLLALLGRQRAFLGARRGAVFLSLGVPHGPPRGVTLRAVGAFAHPCA